jgi:hypothetical protein
MRGVKTCKHAPSIFITIMCRSEGGTRRRHRNALGLEVFEDKNGTIAFSFNGGPKVSVAAGINGCRAEAGDDEKRKIGARAVSETEKQLILEGNARKLLKLSCLNRNNLYPQDSVTERCCCSAMVSGP